MRVLVCGGRDYLNYTVVDYTLCEHAKYPGWKDNPPTIIQGGAKGADFLAKVWAYENNVPCKEYPADWKTYGKAAGHIRNALMLEEGKPDLVVAFPGGRGTADMVTRAKKAGIEVKEIK